jgi:hypothetical protein
MAQPSKGDSQFADATGNPMLGAQGAAITAAPAITAYTAHATGAVAVLSEAATDLDTTAAALKALRDEVALIATAVDALISALEAQGFIADN